MSDTELLNCILVPFLKSGFFAFLAASLSPGTLGTLGRLGTQRGIYFRDVRRCVRNAGRDVRNVRRSALDVVMYIRVVIRYVSTLEGTHTHTHT